MKRTIVLFIVITLSQGALAMSLFDAGKTCVFSHVKARLTKNGKPLQHVKVIRRWEWNDDAKEDVTTTDDDGYFEFPAEFKRSVTRLLPIEVVISQSLYVMVDGEKKLIWAFTKRDSDENGEFNGKPISLKCEVTNELKVTRAFQSIMETLCTLEN